MVSSSRRRVDYCGNSTVSEAWAVVLGLAGKVDETEPPVLERTARERIVGLEPRPAIVAVNARSEAVPPFWRQQLTWHSGRHLARFGHRYLSTHFTRQGDDRYETFGKSLEPAVKKWLDIYVDALGPTSKEHLVDRVGFGYVNQFEFPAEGFDLSKYFLINVGVEVGIADPGLLGLDAGFRLFDKEGNVYLVVELNAVPLGDEASIGVTTKVLAERRGLEEVSFANREELAKLVRSTKEAAKEVFFGFATDETHRIMGAVHASNES